MFSSTKFDTVTSDGSIPDRMEAESTFRGVSPSLQTYHNPFELHLPYPAASFSKRYTRSNVRDEFRQFRGRRGGGGGRWMK